jgi:hypothetical protein
MKRWLQLGLLVLAVVQVSALGMDRIDSPAELVPMGVGDVVSVSDVPVAKNGLTVFMAFRESCIHCQSVAAAWGSWMNTPRSGVTVVAITMDETEVGQRFADQWGWQVPVVSLIPDDWSSPVSQLVRRTPWAWVLDSDGVIRYQGHGGDLEALADALATAGEEVS